MFKGRVHQYGIYLQLQAGQLGHLHMTSDNSQIWTWPDERGIFLEEE
jgi:hypothetical protein